MEVEIEVEDEAGKVADEETADAMTDGEADAPQVESQVPPLAA